MAEENQGTVSREAEVFYARLAEQAERYEEMAERMKQVAKAYELTVEERNLLSVAYKNMVGCRRASWRIVSSAEGKEVSRGDSKRAAIASGYRKKIEEELRRICNDIITLLDKHLIQSTQAAESAVFYWKMKGDYYRYIAEFTTDEERNEASNGAKLAYERATELAETQLDSTHPIRLGLALNYSVFYYEIFGAPDKAVRIAQTAFDDSIAQLDNLGEDSYRDSTLIMQLLRDNLTLWTNSGEGEAPEEGFAGPKEEVAGA